MDNFDDSEFEQSLVDTKFKPRTNSDSDEDPEEGNTYNSDEDDENHFAKVNKNDVK